MDKIVQWSVAALIVAIGAHFIVDRLASPSSTEVVDQKVNFEASVPTASQQSTDHIEDPIPGRAVELKAGSNGHFHLEARINGRNVPFLVDTGASFIALSHEAAQDIGIYLNKEDYTIRLNTANGVIKGAHVTLPQLRYESIRMNNLSAVVLPKGALGGSNLLGNSFLSRLEEFKIKNGRLIMIP